MNCCPVLPYFFLPGITLIKKDECTLHACIKLIYQEIILHVLKYVNIVKKKILLFKFYSFGSLNQCTSIFTTTRYFLLAQHESLIICLKIASCAISILQREVKSHNLPALAITWLTVKLSSKDCVTVALKC